MNGRRCSLPTLLALSVAAALGSGTFAPASRSETPPKTSYSASWECTAGLHQDWRCSPEPGMPYADKLEQIGGKRSTLRGSLSNLMQKAYKKSQESSDQKADSKPDSKPDSNASAKNKQAEAPADEFYATKTDDSSIEDIHTSEPQLTTTHSSSQSWTPIDSPAKTHQQKTIENTQQLPQHKQPHNPLHRSMADSDWVSRLKAKTAWPDDQTLLPRRKAQQRSSLNSDGVTEEEVNRSVLLTEWLEKAQRRASWASEDTPEKSVTPESDTLLNAKTGNRQDAIADLDESEKEEPVLRKETDNKKQKLYADDWLQQAEQRTAWAEEPAVEREASNEQAIEENEELWAKAHSTSDEQAGNPDLQLVSSLDLSNTAPSVTESSENQSTLSLEEITATAPQIKHKEQPQPPHRAFGRSLLAHQISAPALVHTTSEPFSSEIASPRSVKSAHKNMPAFKLALSRAQQEGISPSGLTAKNQLPGMNRVQQTQIAPQPQPQPVWLPDVEVTPNERLSRAAPKFVKASTQNMPWRSKAAPEQWKHAPSGTNLPWKGHQQNLASSRPANTFVTPNGITLPRSQTVNSQVRAPQKKRKTEASVIQSWSLTGQSISRAALPVQNPVSDRVPERVMLPTNNDKNWPEPEYTANSRLAPGLPQYSEPSWPGAERGYIKERQSYSTDALRKKHNLNTFRRPPPISPKDIYKMAASDEPTSAGSFSGAQGNNKSQQSSPFDRFDKKIPKGPNSVNRLIERTRERAPEPTAQVKPQPASSVHPKQPGSQQIRSQQQAIPQYRQQPSSMAGMQQVSLPPKTHHRVSATLEQMVNAPAQSVSIQWLSTTQPSHILKLQRRYPTLKEATVVRFLSKGKIWYLLLTGIHKNTHSAMTLLRSPEYKNMARRLNPWTRPLASLKSLKLLKPKRHTTKPQSRNTLNNPASLPQGQYTIQWMQSEDPGILVDLKKRYPQLNDAEVVMVTRNKKVQYLLIQGRYTNNTGVEKALGAPRYATLAYHLNPKPRPMASLKHKVPEVKQPLVTQVSVPMDKHTNKILQSPEGTFTIQWLAAHKPKMLESLKHKYPALRSAETIHFRRNEKDWYVLIQGQFNSYRSALQALQQPELQELASKLKPWTRSVSGLRDVAGS